MTQYFLVHNGYEIVKLNKGITEEKVNELLGSEYITEPGKHVGELKRVYDFKKMGASKNLYKLLLREGQLEWIMKVSQN